MTERALSIAGEHAPWRSETPWWLTGIEGIVLVAIGLFLLLAPGPAGGVIVQLIAAILLIESILNIASGLRGTRSEADPYVMLQAGIGAAIGLLLVLRSWLVPTLDTNSARVMLALGLLAYALVGAAKALADRGGADSWLRPLINTVLLVVLAIALLTSGEHNAADRLALLGWIALVGGVLSLGVAWYARSRAASA